MLMGVIVVSAAGLAVCIYGFFLERKLKYDQRYKAVCDLSDKVSCTKTFLSPYSKMFGISNTYIGMLFYAGMILMGLLDQANLAFLGAVAACIASVFFAYILYSKVQTFCLLCVSIYAINVILLFSAYQYL